MAKKVYHGEDLFKLGALTYPLLSFKERDEILKKSQPGMTEQERAAVVYFGILAETPTPTASGTYNSLVYETVEEQEPDFTKWPEYEEEMKYSAFPVIPVTERSLQESYAINLYHLQNWLIRNGLYSGIEKTLSEESRQRQSVKASLDAQAAAAAKALAYGRITQDEADKVNERVKKQQEEIERQLKQLKAGLLPDEDGGGYGTSSGISSAVPLAIAAAAALFAFKG